MRNPIHLFFLVPLFLLFWSSQSFALELYSFVGKNCRVETGLIVQANRNEVAMLTTSGEFSQWKRRNIRHVLVYNVLNNPIPSISMQRPLEARVRSVELSGEERLRFTGWPIRFFENLIVFYDIEGKTHIEEIERIRSISKPIDLPKNIPITTHEKIQFGLGNNLPECPQPRQSGEVTLPTRMLSDQIRIGKFLSVYQHGFERLTRFEKRTVFYARPFLFEQPTQMGITLSEGVYLYRKELPIEFPFTIQWSNGQPYGPQAFFKLGSSTVELLPNIEPVFAIRTDVKAHLFTAAFVGNPLGMSQGADFIVENRFSFQEFFSRVGPDDLLVAPQFNQLALTGMEWGSQSISLGFFHPVYAVLGNRVFREVLFPEPTLIGRYQYITEKKRYRFLYSAPSQNHKAPTPKDIRVVSVFDMLVPGLLSPESFAYQGGLESFSIQSQFMRIGADLDISKEVELRLDGVFLAGSYQEQMLGSDYKLEFRQALASLSLIQSFGERVSILGFLNYFQRHYDSLATDRFDNPTSRRFSLVGTIRFVL